MKEEVVVSAYAKGSDERTVIGTISNLNLDLTTFPTSGTTLILSKDQTIFPPSPPDASWWLFPGPHFLGGNGTGRLKFVDGKEKSVFLTISPEVFQVTGVHEGKNEKLIRWRF